MTAVDDARQAAVERATAAFLRACELDVAVRKPGNVSVLSPGHGMDAALFIASARAAAPALCARGAPVGMRIERAMAATWAVAGCNTNLGILLLCAPIAAAVERRPEARSAAALARAIESVLADLDREDARAAYRAIVQAMPAGLGTAPQEDVRTEPGVNLRAAMGLAAERDRIARQYRDGFEELFDQIGSLTGADLAPAAMCPASVAPDPTTVVAVQRIYLSLLSNEPDSHIVRKHGEAVAHSVMRSAAAWYERLYAREDSGAGAEDDPGFAAWDQSLKRRGINPGTTADLTVAALMLAALSRG